MIILITKGEGGGQNMLLGNIGICYMCTLPSIAAAVKYEDQYINNTG